MDLQHMRGSLLNVTVVGNKRDLAHEYRSVTTQEAMVIIHACMYVSQAIVIKFMYNGR